MSDTYFVPNLGKTDPDKVIHLSIIVRRKNELKLHELDGIVSHSDFNDKYAASQEDVDGVANFAREKGLWVDFTDVSRRTVKVHGTVRTIAPLFGVILNDYKNESGCIYHDHIGFYDIPKDIADRVEAVFGLNSKPIAKPYIKFHDSNAKSYTASEVAKLYQFPSSLNGEGQSIAFIELGGGFRQTDLDEYFKGLGLTPSVAVSVDVDGASNSPGDPNGADGEVALDMQVAGAIAPNAKLVVYFTTNTAQGFMDAITTAVHDEVNKPSVISISWGGPEDSWGTEQLTAFDNACQSAGALGVTITVASGDNGSTDGETGNHVDFPASSPHVLACGGTLLESSGEQVWDDLPTGGGASGGGFSNFFLKPNYQVNAHKHVKRGVPDVSGDAAPSSGYNIIVDGTPQTVGGTSAVAPLYAGLIALINQSRVNAGKSTLGFVNPTLYNNRGDFNDITIGNNGAFKATPHWDACTGLGSPNGIKLLKTLE